MLLLACALATLAALGALAHPGLDSKQAGAASSSGPPSAPVNQERTGRPLPPPDVAPLPFVPLISSPLTDRFPRLTVTVSRQPLLPQTAQIVSYYGTPYTPALGALGAADLTTVAARLEEHAARYDRLNGPPKVVPALHLVYAVAQWHPTQNGRYLQYADDGTVRRYVDFAAERGMLLFLDLQIGRSSVGQELRNVLPYLRLPHVHLALDPEFSVGPGQVPGLHLGSLGATDINGAQRALHDLVEAEGLPPKLLIVHQFTDSMVPDGEGIARYPGVELVVDVDGFGPAAIKRATYERYAARPYATHGGVKLFFEHDPDLMSEQEVLSLQPQPKVIIYQ